MVTLLNELQSEISSQVGDVAASSLLPKFPFGLETQDMIQDSRVSVNKEHEGLEFIFKRIPSNLFELKKKYPPPPFLAPKYVNVCYCHKYDKQKKCYGII